MGTTFVRNNREGLDLGSAFNWSGSAVCAAVWYRPDSFTTSDARIFSKSVGSNSEDHVFMISLSSSKFPRFRFKTGTDDANGTNTLIGAEAFTIGTWSHVVMQYTGAAMNIFIDGATNGTTGQSGSVRENTWNAQWGNNPANMNNQGIDGTLADAACWNTALSLDEITALANGTCPLRIRPDQLFHYLRMGIGTGNQPDWGGNFNGTFTSTTSVAFGIGDHPPVQQPFGYDMEWQALQAVAAGAVPDVATYYRMIEQRHNPRMVPIPY